MHEIKQTLVKLITEDNSSGRQIITGFNFFSQAIKNRALAVLSFSNIHSHPEYLSLVKTDLRKIGYPNQKVSLNVRQKIGYFRWLPGFIFRDDEGLLEQGLRITDTSSGEVIDLEAIAEKTLICSPYQDSKQLLAENAGYEIDIFARYSTDLRKIAELFLRKASMQLLGPDGQLINETPEEHSARAPWPHAWDTPIIILGGAINKLRKTVPGFKKAILLRKVATNTEYNFVINKAYEAILQTEEYGILKYLGFVEQPCLANTKFVDDYIDST